MGAEKNSTQAMWVGIGQFFSYAIGIISPMVLSRFFNKGDYGTYQQVMYVYNTLLAVFTLGLPRAYSYFIPRVSLGESKDIIRKITRLFIILGFLFSVLLFLGAPIIAKILNNENLELALKYFSPTPLFLLPIFGLDSILASYKKTQFIAIYSVTTKFFTLLCIVLPVVVFNGTYIHAIIGFDVASFLSFLLALYLRDLPTKDIPWEKTDVTIREIFSFSLPLLVASLWIMVFHSANQFFISRFFGKEAFAEFSNGFIEFPAIPMVVHSVATVLLPVFSLMASKNRDDILIVWNRALIKVIKLIYPMAVYCILFATLIMTCFYGQRYESSGLYFAIKNVEGFFSVIPFYPILLALGKTKQYSRIHMIMAFVIILLEFIIVKLGGSPYMIGIAYVSCAIAKVVMQFLAVSNAVNFTFKNMIPIRRIIIVLCACIIAAIPAILFMRAFPNVNTWMSLLLTVLIYVVVYYSVCWLFHITYRDLVESFIPKSFKQHLNWIP